MARLWVHANACAPENRDCLCPCAPAGSAGRSPRGRAASDPATRPGCPPVGMPAGVALEAPPIATPTSSPAPPAAGDATSSSRGRAHSGPTSRGSGHIASWPASGNGNRGACHQAPADAAGATTAPASSPRARGTARAPTPAIGARATAVRRAIGAGCAAIRAGRRDPSSRDAPRRSPTRAAAARRIPRAQRRAADSAARRRVVGCIAFLLCPGMTNGPDIRE